MKYLFVKQISGVMLVVNVGVIVKDSIDLANNTPSEASAKLRKCAEDVAGEIEQIEQKMQVNRFDVFTSHNNCAAIARWTCIAESVPVYYHRRRLAI